MKDLIDKYKKELDFLNERLNTALFIGNNQKILINAEINVYEKVISDLEKITPETSFSDTNIKKLMNDFLVQTEELDKNKMPWETKNHIPILHQSLNEFYGWLKKNH